MNQESEKTDFCYLCGNELTEEDSSKDHVPPKALSPESPDEQFYKAPCHESCNNKFSHQESIMRDVLAAAGAFKGNESADTAYQSMKRNFQRNPMRRLISPSRDWIRLTQNIKRQSVMSPQGIHLGTRSVIQIPEELDIDALSIKIARGLLHKHTGQVVPKNFKQEGYYFKPDLPNQDIQGLIKMARIFGKMGDFLHYAGALGEEDSSFWIMTIYKSVVLAASFSNPETMESEELN